MTRTGYRFFGDITDHLVTPCRREADGSLVQVEAMMLSLIHI